ncbi:MAG: BatA domain-containing protein, partial [Calditrichaeota bacterium]|nr:BatA domain-containing protein [Calditrichota bacterium]
MNPLLLSALAAISIPIILHILYKRQVIRIDFSSIRFLKELQKNQLVKSSWLELIILLLRVLTIACLVIAFSNPVSELNLPFSLPLKNQQFIYID